MRDQINLRGAGGGQDPIDEGRQLFGRILDVSGPVGAGQYRSHASAFGEVRLPVVEGEGAETGVGEGLAHERESVVGVEPGAVHQHHGPGMLGTRFARPVVGSRGSDVGMGRAVGECGHERSRLRAIAFGVTRVTAGEPGTRTRTAVTVSRSVPRTRAAAGGARRSAVGDRPPLGDVVRQLPLGRRCFRCRWSGVRGRADQPDGECRDCQAHHRLECAASGR